MGLWIAWWGVVWQLRSAFTRQRTFLWAATVLAGFCTRQDLAGVTSFVRCLSLQPKCYGRLLDFFHSYAVCLDDLTHIWGQVCLRIFADSLAMENGRIVLLADGVKNAKEGRKMPGVKLLHQESTNNSKPEFIMGHSCQCVSLLVKTLTSHLAVPLAVRIHEGVKFTNRDKRTLIDKISELLKDATHTFPKFYLVADAFYACGGMAEDLLRSGNHLVTRVRSNAVAFMQPSRITKRTRGRPRLYGKKLRLRSIFDNREHLFTEVDSSLYDDNDVKLKLYSLDLVWRPLGKPVRFVWVIHPGRGKCILVSTDLSLEPLGILSLYGLRFKIEVGFKAAVHSIGAFSYRFWMMGMKKIRRGSGNQHLHRAHTQHRIAVRQKLRAYDIHLQLGAVAQGLLQYLAVCRRELVWRTFRGWLRTMRPDMTPSEAVVAQALAAGYDDFCMDTCNDNILTKFLRKNLDQERRPLRYEAA